MPDSSGAGSKAKVLAVVEDEPDVRLLIRVTFQADTRFEVEAEADSAEEAIMSSLPSARLRPVCGLKNIGVAYRRKELGLDLPFVKSHEKRR